MTGTHERGEKIQTWALRFRPSSWTVVPDLAQARKDGPSSVPIGTGDITTAHTNGDCYRIFLSCLLSIQFFFHAERGRSKPRTVIFLFATSLIP